MQARDLSRAAERNRPSRLRGAAFVSTYLPRSCGIATFTSDLVEAVAGQAGPDQAVIVVSMNDRPEGYTYPERVQIEIREDRASDFARAAEELNRSRIDVVSLQHEYNIFGHDAGSNVLTLLRALRRPVVVTCHTVYQDPEPRHREVLAEIVARAARAVVMSEKAVDLLEEVYGADRRRVVVIPHGVHDVPFVDPTSSKDRYGVEGRRVLLTFGLLHRNKGIEYMIDAMPEIVAQHPKTTYLVLGATHPAVLREEGEGYRLALQRRARERGVEEHVLFHPRFVELDELLEYLDATDIFVTPYLALDHITSGVLAYAAGAGKAIVSTPYWHAQELLADGRGRLVPPRDAAALAREINALLDDEAAMTSMRRAVYAHSRGAIWPAVARRYLALFDEVVAEASRRAPADARRSHPGPRRDASTCAEPDGC